MSLNDAALFVEIGGDKGDSTEDGLLAEAVHECAYVAHAVQCGIDHRLGADGGRHVFDGLVEGLRFDAEEDDVVGAGDLGARDGLGFEREVAVGADDAETVMVELLGASWSDEKGDIPACLRETRSEVTADCAGTNHKNLHLAPSCCWKIRRLCTQQEPVVLLEAWSARLDAALLG